MGTYTSISIREPSAPASAPAGSRVYVELRIQNLASYGFYVYALGILGTTNRFIDWQKAWIGAGQAKAFFGSFIMPSVNSVINAYSYYVDAQGQAWSDDSASKVITVEAVAEAEFRNLVCSYRRA